MLYRHLTDHCQTPTLQSISAQLAAPLVRLQKRGDAGAAPLLALPFIENDLKEIEALAQNIREKFKRVVVVGAGGSGLSGRTLSCLRSVFATPTLHFLENIDPHAIDDLLAHLDAASTCFLVISKSGATVETLAQFYVLLAHMESVLGAQKASEHFIIITTPGSANPMHAQAKERGMTVLAHDANIGGRFSILTNVGLLPAAIAGLNISELRRGAREVVAQMENAKTAQDCPPALGAAIQFAHMQKGCNLSVMLPYCERLSGFSSWYRQIWAESLGKNGKGSTPIRAVGTTDQHSQLQLYLDGPQDKLFHLIFQRRAGTGQKIAAPAGAELDYIRDKTTGDIMEAEQKATFDTLVAAKRPVRLFELDTLAEAQMGALLMHFMLEVIFMAALLEVNPFDQPAVEEGKRLARDALLSGKL